MKKTKIVLILLVALVATAGCIQAPTSGDDSFNYSDYMNDTLETTTTPNTGTTTTTPETEIPTKPNESEILTAHKNSLKGQSFTMNLEIDTTRSKGTQSVSQYQKLTYKWSDDEKWFRLNESRRYITIFDSGENIYLQQKTGASMNASRSRYSQMNETTSPFNFTRATGHYNILIGNSGSTKITETTYKGEPVIKYETYSQNAFNQSNIGASITSRLRENTSIQDFHAVLYVNNEKTVKKANWHITVHDRNQNITTNINSTLEISKVGETQPTTPTWIEIAQNRTDQ